MQKEQIGSAIAHPKFIMQNDEMITPTLPRVSAITCSQIPVEQEINTFIKEKILNRKRTAEVVCQTLVPEAVEEISEWFN